jgi:hypothetical protein
MPCTRRRRIVRRAVMALAVVLLLPVWYVAAWLAVSRAAHDGMIRPATVLTIRPAFAPLITYCESELPAAAWLRGVWWRINPVTVRHGKSLTGSAGVTWVETSALAPVPP